MVIELITSITLLQTSFSLHRANPSEGADTSFQTSEPGRAYKHRVRQAESDGGGSDAEVFSESSVG